MHCDEALNRILYIHNELREGAYGTLERHFDMCPSCRARMAFERRLSEKLKELADVWYPHLVSRRIRRLLVSLYVGHQIHRSKETSPGCSPPSIILTV